MHNNLKQAIQRAILTIFLFGGFFSMAQAQTKQVIFETTKGNISIELNFEKAPISSGNFLQYVEDGFFDGTIFHRVIPGFMVQGGGFEPGMKQKTTRDAIENEAKNGLQNVRGSLSMARTSDINSATSQFFINVADNGFLDHGSRDYGYAVFAKVTEGMDVVDEIVSVPTTSVGHHGDVPREDILVTKAYVVNN